MLGIVETNSIYASSMLAQQDYMPSLGSPEAERYASNITHKTINVLKY